MEFKTLIKQISKLTYLFFVLSLLFLNTTYAAPECDCDAMGSGCDLVTEYEYFTTYCIGGTGSAANCECRPKPSPICPAPNNVPQNYYNLPAMGPAPAINGTSCGTGGTWQCRVTANTGAITANWSCWCTGCPAASASCTNPFGGANIPHGGSITTYQNSTVACGSSCASEVRTCNNGVLSGSYTHQNCTVDSCPSCVPDGDICGGNNYQFDPSNKCVALYGPDTTAASCASQCCSGVANLAEIVVCTPLEMTPPQATARLIRCAPSSCPAPATQACPDGSTVTRNPAPACDFPACPSCTANTHDYTVNTLPQTLSGLPLSDSGCPPASSSSSITISQLPYTLPTGFTLASGVPQANALPFSMTYTWQTASTPPSCVGSATQSCPDGSTVNRNPYPACDFPACPSVCVGPATQSCPDGSTVTRNAYPACDFPECPTVTKCIQEGTTCPLGFACENPPASTGTCDMYCDASFNGAPCPEGTALSQGCMFDYTPDGHGCKCVTCGAPSMMVCSGPSTYTCPGGSVVTRNPYPNCNFPACPPSCVNNGNGCSLDSECCSGYCRTDLGYPRCDDLGGPPVNPCDSTSPPACPAGGTPVCSTGLAPGPISSCTWMCQMPASEALVSCPSY